MWDYGSLGEAEEVMYVKSIVADLFNGEHTVMLVELVTASQKCIKAYLLCHTVTLHSKFKFLFICADIRKFEGPESVSMRDVKRCKILILWFSSHLLTEGDLAPKGRLNVPTKKKDRGELIKGTTSSVRSIVLALAHCYHCRLASQDQREEYRGILL